MLGWVLQKAAAVLVVMTVLVVTGRQGAACRLLAAGQGCRTHQEDADTPRGLEPAAACLMPEAVFCALVDLAVVWEAQWALVEPPAQTWVVQQGLAAPLVAGRQYRGWGEEVLVVGMVGVAVEAWVVGVGA